MLSLCNFEFLTTYVAYCFVETHRNSIRKLAFSLLLRIRYLILRTYNIIEASIIAVFTIASIWFCYFLFDLFHMGERFNIHSQLEHQQAKYTGKIFGRIKYFWQILLFGLKLFIQLVPNWACLFWIWFWFAWQCFILYRENRILLPLVYIMHCTMGSATYKNLGGGGAQVTT